MQVSDVHVLVGLQSSVDIHLSVDFRSVGKPSVWTSVGLSLSAWAGS